MNIVKLKAKMVEEQTNVEKLAKAIHKDKATLYRKFANGGDTFTLKEAELISKELNMTYEEVNDIFFTNFVA